VAEGVVPGGGTALLRAAKAVARLAKGLEGDIRTGAEILARSLEAPARMIAQNAGLEGAVVVGKVLDEKDYAFGYNAEAEKYEDLNKAGVIDPAKVPRVAIQNAASVAGLLLTTDVAVADLPEKKKKGAPSPDAGMDDF
jgi:chaperonin GroEL